jgi:hypothetical protein
MDREHSEVHDGREKGTALHGDVQDPRLLHDQASEGGKSPKTAAWYKQKLGAVVKFLDDPLGLDLTLEDAWVFIANLWTVLREASLAPDPEPFHTCERGQCRRTPLSLRLVAATRHPVRALALEAA